MDADKFVTQWTESIIRGSAAVFVGAGLSIRAGYPSWRGLLAEVAFELGLDIEAEHDLAAVAQYSLNRSARNRGKLAQLIAENFRYKHDAPEPFRILARLPIRHFWTTNYDNLLEVAFRLERRDLDSKSRNDDVGMERPGAHAVLYKMHGTVEHPTEVVIAKDDYELYRRVRPNFLHALTGHLITKQMLFLGFSFTDPNLALLFGAIREASHEAGPVHYAIVRRPQRPTGADGHKRYETEKVRHQLWVEDLQRYGIHCVEVDQYEDVDSILKAVERRLANRSVFVSGSLPADASAAQRSSVEAFAREVGRVIAKNHKRLVSGYGLTVGSAAISGALGEIMKAPHFSLDDGLLLRPFPLGAPPGFDIETFRERYRDNMIQQAGVCVFICGLRQDPKTSHVEIAPGVIAEFNRARHFNRILIPIGATGGAALEIWRELSASGNWTLPGLSRLEIERLGDTGLKPEEAGQLIERVLVALNKDLPTSS